MKFKIFHLNHDFFSQFEEAVGKLPDTKLPVANQLEQAIATIKANVRIILDTQAESKRLKQVRYTQSNKMGLKIDRIIINYR